MGSESIAVVAQFSLKEGAEQEFFAALEALAPRSLRDPGLESFRAHRDPEAPNRVLFYELWENRASFEQSLRAEWREDYMAATQHLWGEERVVGVWEPLPFSWQKGDPIPSPE